MTRLEQTVYKAALRDYIGLYPDKDRYFKNFRPETEFLENSGEEEAPFILDWEVDFCQGCESDHCDRNYVSIYVEDLDDDHRMFKVAEYQFECNEDQELLSMTRIYARIINQITKDCDVVSLNHDLENFQLPRRVIRCEGN